MPEYCDANELDELRRKLLWRGPAAGRRSLPQRLHGSEQQVQPALPDVRLQRSARSPRCAKYDLPRWAYDRIAAELFPRASYVCLSLMTEPFMTRDFPERPGRAAKHGVPFSDVITNGTLMTEEAIAMILDSRPHAPDRFDRRRHEGDLRERSASARTSSASSRNFTLLRTRPRRERNATLPRLRINHVLSRSEHRSLRRVPRRSSNCWKPEEVAVRTVSRMSEAVIQESTTASSGQGPHAIRVKLAAFCARPESSMRLFPRPPHDDRSLHRHGRKADLPHAVDDDRRPSQRRRLSVHGLVAPAHRQSHAADARRDLERRRARRAFATNSNSVQPGLDCLNCTIRRPANDPDDDFFYRKLAVPAVS